MATDTKIGSLPVADDGVAEALTSALPTTSTAAAERSTNALFDPLHEAKSSLHHQTETSAQLHPLHSSFQSLYSASSADGRLTRDHYRQLIAQIRHSVSQFAATTPVLRSQSSTEQQSNDASIANQMRRYISLLTETSTHTAALAHSIAPIKSADSDRKDAPVRSAPSTSSALFPRQLQAGVFDIGSPDRPTTSWKCALHTLGALCETLDSTAKPLGLETFSEPSSDATEAPTDSTTNRFLTHTLTLGAKILVIDIELHIVKDSTAHGFQPKAKLKLSYATDSADSHQSRDPRLGAVLERDVQLIADKLFGTVTPSSPQKDRTVAAQALANWTTNLSELLALDDLEARASEAASAGTRPTDLFAAMQELCSAAVRVSDAEASSCSSDPVLLDRGHGLHKLHASRPFLHCVYAHDPTSRQDYTLSIGVEALSLPVGDQTSADITAPSFPLSQPAQDLLASLATSNPAQTLGSIASSTDSQKRVPLHFVVRLSPPVVVTRPTAAKLASICNLKQITPHHTNPGAPGVASTGATWFEDVLASTWSSRPQQDPEDARKSTRCTFTLAQTVESVRSTESQGLIIDSLPLLSSSSPSADAMDEGGAAPQVGASILGRLFAAIEVLRDEVKVTELMHSAVTSSQNATDPATDTQGQEDDLSLDGILASASSQDSSKIAVTIAFRTPISGATDEAQQNLSLQLAFRTLADDGATVVFDASIAPSKRTSEIGWLLSAVAKVEASGSTGSKEARLDSAASEARSIVEKLNGLESLEDVVIGLLSWAERELGVRLKKPAAESAFDPLSYEQQNVHAIYETIAPHFSNTRYKPWPLIPAFLSTIPAGSLGADLGCGNGKYLPIRSTLATEPSAAETKRQDSLLTVGVDRSSNLIGLAQTNFGMMDGGDGNKTSPAAQEGRRHEVAVGDAIHSSLRTGLFDYAISIATIHHFSTWERRRASVQELIRVVAPVEAGPHPDNNMRSVSTDPRLEGMSGRGRFMIFVWALEQKDEGKRHFQADDPESLQSQREIHDPNHDKSKDRLVSYSGLQTVGDAETQAKVTVDQDVLVPWVLSTAAKKKPKAARATKGRKPRLTDSETHEIEAGLSSLKVTPEAEATSEAKKQDEDASRPVFNRYYHMFRSGELEALVADAAATMPAVHRRPIQVVREAGGWERGNWWGVWRVQSSQP